MNTQIKKTTAGVLGAAVLAGSTFLTVAPVCIEQGNTIETTQNARETNAASTVESAGFTQVDKVEGSFSFDQNVISDNAIISNVFCKAASALCASLPEYGVQTESGVIKLSSANRTSLETTTSELSDSGESEHRIMTCACSSNVPGGGAIANADVEGVSVASLAQQAGVL